jgi:hypothetical protein
MRKRLTTVLLSGGAVALALSLGATTVQATTAATWTVKPGGSISISGSVQATDTTTGTVVKCTSVKLSGTLKKGSGLSGTGIGSITKASFTDCTLGTISVTVTAEDLPMRVDVLKYTMPKRVVWFGLFRWLWWIRATACSADLQGKDGAAKGYTYADYSDSSAKLTLGPKDNLVAASVSGCLGLVNNGDPQMLSGDNTMSPKQLITSP